MFLAIYIIHTHSSHQLQLRPYYDIRYRLFANVALLQHGNSRALVHYVAKAHAVNVVVVGAPSPQEFMRTLETMLKDVVARRLRREQCTMRQLCPRCIQGAGIYSTVDANGKACSAGHTLSVEDMQQGVLWEKRSWCRNSIWTSKVLVDTSASATYYTRLLRLHMCNSLTLLDARGILFQW